MDPALVHWVSQLENILSQSYTEQNSYDFKQGFLRLDGSNVFDEGNFEKILSTSVGIANINKTSRGYILIGVAETEATTAKIEDLFSIKSRKHESFFITGVEHEGIALGKNLDQLFQIIVDKIRASKISDPLKNDLVTNIKLVRYYDLSVFVIQIDAQADPSNIGGKYFVRHGSQLTEILPGDLAVFIRRYIGNP